MKNYIKTAVPAILLGVTIFFSLFSKQHTAIKVGDKARSFALQDEKGHAVTLSDFKGKTALIFFPKAHTLSFGCKKQVCSVRDGFADLKEHGITVYGLTNSSLDNMQKFVANNHLPFTLLHATPEVMQAYGVSGGWFGAKRHTVLVNDGIVVAVITDVDLDEHAQQILKGFGYAE